MCGVCGIAYVYGVCATVHVYGVYCAAGCRRLHGTIIASVHVISCVYTYWDHVQHIVSFLLCSPTPHIWGIGKEMLHG